MFQQTKMYCCSNCRYQSTKSIRKIAKYFLPLFSNSHSFENNQGSQQNKSQYNSWYKKYATHTVVVLSALSAYYLYTTNPRKVYAFGIQKPYKCGEYKKGLTTYSAKEVSKHDCKDKRIWVTFREGVYDITDFVDKHPGGSGKIMMAAGGSIESFWKIFANHNKLDIHNLLESMRIGNLEKSNVYQNSKEDFDPYGNEPPRNKILKINGHKPFCAEPPASMLVENYYTPTKLFYVRNHLPVPEVCWKDYTLELAIETNIEKTLNFEDLKKYPKHTITSAIMCGGNRRSEMAEVKPLRGLSWGIGAIGNAKWSGTRLCDVLKDLGINENDYNHIQFEGLDIDPSGMPYAVSIPISKAMDPKADVLLAYEMNGQLLSQDHGFPIRVVVPGVVGARNVKWLGKIIVSKNESPSQWQQGDYKGFSPNVNWDNVDFSKSPAIQEMPVTSAICMPQTNETVVVKNGKITAKGYAYSGGGRKIIRVDISIDQGETWHTANLIKSDSTAKENQHWGWTLWEVNLPIDLKKREVEIWVKAVDSSYNVQPESFKNVWNLRGLLCNAYHRVPIMLSK